MADTPENKFTPETPPNRIVSGPPAPPDAKMWVDYSDSLKRDAPNRYEDAAKFLATIISLSISILFTLHDKMKLFAQSPNYVFLFLGIWLVALFFAFMVLFPSTYHVQPRDVGAIKKVQTSIIRKKRFRFTLSVWLYFVSLAVLIASYALRLNLQQKAGTP